jgi:type IV fimbrial biogenesis protein FimT
MQAAISFHSGLNPRALRGARRRGSIGGVTLVEALLVLAISATLLSVGLPSLRGLVASLRIRQVSYQLSNDMVLAKSEAIKRNSRVVVCNSLDGQSCASNRAWEHGWIIFHDTNNSGTREPSEVLVRSYAIANPAATISGNGNVEHYVSYSGLGTTKMLYGAFQAGRFTLCPLDRGEQQARQVIINSTGKVRVARAPMAVCGAA